MQVQRCRCRCIYPRSLPHTALVPSHDLGDPGHRLSRHKLDLANRSPASMASMAHMPLMASMALMASMLDSSTRILNMTGREVAGPAAPTIAKACYVYIYISVEMSEAVVETEGYPEHGFSACCCSSSTPSSCLQSGGSQAAWIDL